MLTLINNFKATTSIPSLVEQPRKLSLERMLFKESEVLH